jgi:hypothetical protein
MLSQVVNSGCLLVPETVVHRCDLCLVIRQPYASLIVYGRKRWEFRRNESKIRGLIGIAASPHEPLKTRNEFLNRASYAFPRGYVLATAELTSAFFVTADDLSTNITKPVKVSMHGYEVETTDEPIGEPLEDVRSASGMRDWQSYAWLLENVKPLGQLVHLPPSLEKSTWVTMEVPLDAKEI